MPAGPSSDAPLWSSRSLRDGSKTLPAPRSKRPCLDAVSDYIHVYFLRCWSRLDAMPTKRSRVTVLLDLEGFERFAAHLDSEGFRTQLDLPFRQTRT